VADLGTGVDVAVRFDSAVRIVQVVFALLKRTMVFAWAVRSITFGWAARAVEFALNS
jgi:hypothetical protein